MIRDEIKKAIKNAYEKNPLEGTSFSEFILHYKKPPREEWGDIGVSLSLAVGTWYAAGPYRKGIDLDPSFCRNIVDSIAADEQFKEVFKEVEFKGPVFINFFIKVSYLQKEIENILKERDDYGKSNIGQGKKVQVEFISANPTGPLTLGNGRGGFFGDVLANVLAKAGYQASREYFINDLGNQIEVLGHSVLKDAKAQYRGEYIDSLHKKFTGFLKSQDPKKVGQKAANYLMEKMIEPTIEQRMKIKFDNWVSQKKLQQGGAMDKILKLLKTRAWLMNKKGLYGFVPANLAMTKTGCW